MKKSILFSFFTSLLASMMLFACEKPVQPEEPKDPDNGNTETPVDPEKPGDPEDKDPIEALELEGYAIFFQDRTSWGATHIYGWNAEAGSVTSGWPGNPVTGTVDIEDVTYKYVDMGKALEGKTMKLIFNCNSSQNTQDGYEVTMNRHYFMKVTDDSAEEVDPYFSEDASEEFSLSATSASFASLPTGGKSVSLSSKHSGWTVDLGQSDWIVILDENGEKVTSGPKSDKAQYLNVYAAPNATMSAREATITFATEDKTQTVEFAVNQYY